jgi:hypothetical protein
VKADKNCPIDAELWMAYLRQPDQYPHVERQLSTSPAYRQLLELLGKSALEEEDALTCRQCEADMPEYLMVQLAGDSRSQRFVAVERHLRTCPYCYRRYRALLEVNRAISSGDIAAVDIPTPDLSFLREQDTQAMTTLERLLNLKEVVVAQLTIPRLRAQTLPIRQGMRLQASERVQRMYHAEALAVDVNVTLQYGQAGQLPATLRGQIIPLQCPLSQLAGNTVTLFQEEERLAHSQISASGNFTFYDVDEGIYKIVIRWSEAQNLLIEVLVEDYEAYEGKT